MSSYKELSGKSEKELQEMLKDMHNKLFNLRFQKAAGDDSLNNAEFRKTRKVIARINTYINQLKKEGK